MYPRDRNPLMIAADTVRGIHIEIGRTTDSSRIGHRFMRRACWMAFARRFGSAIREACEQHHFRVSRRN